MKTKARIQMLLPTQEGISKATGNKWMQKEVVMELPDDNGTLQNTDDRKQDMIVASTFNTDIIKKFGALSEGDVVEVTLSFRTRARSFRRQDGTEGIIRNTDITIIELNTDNTPL